MVGVWRHGNQNRSMLQTVSNSHLLLASAFFFQPELYISLCRQLNYSTRDAQQRARGDKETMEEPQKHALAGLSP